MAPVIANMAGRREAVALTPFTGPITVVTVAVAVSRPGAFAPTLVVAVASIPLTVTAIREILVAIAAEVSSAVEIAAGRISKAVAIATGAIRVAETARDLRATRVIAVATERTPITRFAALAGFASLALRIVAGELQKVADPIFARSSGLISPSTLVNGARLTIRRSFARETASFS